MQDSFATHANGLESPASHAFAIIPNDSSHLSEVTRALYVGGGGDLTVTLLRSAGPATFLNVPAGTIMPLRVTRVHATGTTAQSIVGMA